MLDRWIGSPADRAPMALSGLFVGSVAVLAITVWEGISAGHWHEPGGTLLAAGALFLPVSCVVWPALRWRPPLTRGRRALSLVYLASTLLVLSTGDIAGFLLVGVATVHAVFVFGRRGGIAFGAVLVSTGFTLVAVFRGVVWAAVIESSVVALFVAWAVATAHVLLSARDRAEQSQRLLAELSQAHEELRRHADRARELTIADERARMSRELHDSAGHYLTVINIGLLNALRGKDSAPEDAWEEVSQARQLTQEALTDTRRWVRALKPLALEGRSSGEAMAMLAQSFDGTGLDVRFTDSGHTEIPEEVALILYRALQEGLTNVVRHSGAGRVDIELERCDGEVSLSIRDDGDGAAGITMGNGLDGLRQRISSAQGQLHVAERGEGGTELRVVLPFSTAVAV